VRKRGVSKALALKATAHKERCRLEEALGAALIGCRDQQLWDGRCIVGGVILVPGSAGAGLPLRWVHGEWAAASSGDAARQHLSDDEV
jgi:hypothetical protein